MDELEKDLAAFFLPLLEAAYKNEESDARAILLSEVKQLVVEVDAWIESKLVTHS